MPDKRRHRGAYPQDATLFAPKQWPRLRQAVSDYSWLLSRGYSAKAGLMLVGDRYQLAERQRLAVMRCSCSDESLEGRRSRMVSTAEAAGQEILIDGYNVLTTIEAALSGGVVLRGRDGCYRDIASMHGTFRHVEETVPAIEVIGGSLKTLGVSQAVWYLDSPVSNSGRLKGMLLQLAKENSWPWQVEVVMNPDPVLAEAQSVIATADSVILDKCHQWFNLARWIIDNRLTDVPVVYLSIS